MTTINPERFADAVRFASESHAGQTRKGGEVKVPYLCHLLVVSGLVLEHGGDEDQAIGALLHDAIEDCDDVTRDVIAERFGEAVAAIVSDCTDTLPGDTKDSKAPWRERKELYIEHLKEASAASALVAACDKCHNLTAMVGDLRTRGLSVLGAFKGSPEDQVWFYREVLAAITQHVPRRLALEIEQLVRELKLQIQGGETKCFRLDEAKE